MTDSSALAGLANVYLEDSYVLAIEEREDGVIFKLDAVLTPSHPAYRDPGPNEQHCYRRGTLAFVRASKIEWIQRCTKTYFDGAGEEDLGNIDSLTKDGGAYTVEGDWGIVRIESSADPTFELEC